MAPLVDGARRALGREQRGPVTELGPLSFQGSELGAALCALVRKAGLMEEPPLPEAPAAGDIEPWLSDTGERLGVDIVSVSSTCGELDSMLRRIGPALLYLPREGKAKFLIVLGGGTLGVRVLTPAGDVRLVRRSVVRDALMRHLFEAEQASLSALMTDLELADELGASGLYAFTLERISEAEVRGIWLVRPSPGAEVGAQARGARLPLLFALLVLARAMSTGLTMLLVWLVGRDVFGSGDARSSPELWALCAFSVVPLRVLEMWAQSRLSLDASVLLKESLLYGILHLDRTAARRQGAGQFLGMAIEGEVASSAMDSGLVMLGAVVDMVAAMIVLGAGVEGEKEVVLFLGWLAVTAALCWRYARRAREWASVSGKVTHDLVERMVGYQTRLAQEHPEDRHREEDALLHEYLFASQEMDRRRLGLDGVLSTGWLILGVMALEPALTSGTATSAKVALALGGIIMAGNALKSFIGGVLHLSDVWIAWQRTAPILEAGRRALAEGTADRGARARPSPQRAGDASLLRFNDLSLRYSEKRPAVLRGCSQHIDAGDRVLLEGASGGGKSTLAIVLACMRAPDAGTIWLFDERTADMPPDHVHQRIVLVPQFHDNHILTESLAFNLLLGRRWPATAADMEDAAAVCEVLGLGPLLARMPQGLAQPVGDGGWTLSHGERSRIFLARSLLQEHVELIILDESFAALDPETLRLSCGGILAAAPTLLVIAHP